MEAAQHGWRPLGELLVEKGVISAEELGDALEEQQVSGLRLGEILIARGFASRPGIAEALAEQRGLVLEPERGFGTGLRGQIERRHREQRLHVVDDEGAEADDDGVAARLERSLDESLVATAAALGERDESDRLRGEVERLMEGLAAAAQRIAELEANLARRDDEAESLDATIDRARRHVAERRERLPLQSVGRSS
ncbi:MAG TPA: hypothetical protein VLB86_15025 [Gaiellaceae bacterium]|nr:hypothetical protein [Gaiellaceae bacterium]